MNPTIKVLKLKLQDMKENYSELLKLPLPIRNKADVEMAISVIEDIEKYVDEDLEDEIEEGK
ncbi:MAG: hypothetical protein WC309_04385 [Candidatus Paceibacterota bacterium]